MGINQGVHCKHPDCLFRNQNMGEHHACEYSLMTGRTRTKKNERLDTANCRHYVPRPKMPRRRGVGITGPLWEPVAIALQKAGFDNAEIARILGLEPEGVEKCLNARLQRKPKGANDSLSRFDWKKPASSMNRAQLTGRLRQVLAVHSRECSTGGLPTALPATDRREGGRHNDRRT